MYTVTAQLRLLLLAFLSLSILGCKSVSTVPSIPPTAPEVPCQKGATDPTPAAPRASDWVDAYGMISEPAVTWINEVLALLDEERELRQQEHNCLDELEKKGHIRQ